MAEFSEIIEFTLRWEGGYVKHPRDPGGATNFGISQRRFRDLNIEELTKEQAIEIYREHYWNKIRGDELPRAIAFVLFDYAVHSGKIRAVSDLQSICKVPPRDIDGRFGPQTMGCVQETLDSYGEYYIAKELLRIRTDRLCNLVAKVGNRYTYFLLGWMRRVTTMLRILTLMEAADTDHEEVYRRSLREVDSYGKAKEYA